MRGFGQAATGAKIYTDFYVYSAVFAALAFGASATQNITVQADSDFILQKLTYQADIAAGNVTDSSRIIPLVTVLITDSGSGRQIMDRAIPVATFFGTGNLPFILPNPKVFKARANITIQATNYSAGTTYNLYLSLIGIKTFSA